MAIPDSFLDELVGRTDITELASGYVRLRKKSGGNMFGLCPFHSEKTPSFSVNAEKQIYHCFGCGKGGGCISFIMEIENLGFHDAVEFLARRAGMTMPENETEKELAGKRKRMLELNRSAARHFFDMLASPLGVNARSYIAKRGISGAMITRFGLGVAPDHWSLLLETMSAKGFSEQELIEAGLARKSKKESGVYDLFRNRLVFPVINIRGDVIGFSGRILGEGEPKYVNSPDTIVFSKSRNLFALNAAKKTKAGMLILVEGNIDVVTLHQAGFDCAVASLGTALTAEQARLMSRYTEKAVLAFDSDDAGRKAALRAIPLLEKTGMSVNVVNMGDCKDPDEYLKKHGADAFKLLLERSGNHIEYRLAMIKNNAELNSDEDRISYIAAATDMLAELSSVPEREVYGARVAQAAGVSPESVSIEIEKKTKARMTRQKKEFERRVTRPTAALQPEDKSLRYQNEYSAAAEEELIRCLMHDTSLFRIAEGMGFSSEEFTSQFLKKVYVGLAKREAEGSDTSAPHIMRELETHEAARLSVILQKPDSLPYSEKPVRDCIEKIRTEKFKLGDPDGDLLLEIKRHKKKKQGDNSYE